MQQQSEWPAMEWSCDTVGYMWIFGQNSQAQKIMIQIRNVVKMCVRVNIDELLLFSLSHLRRVVFLLGLSTTQFSPPAAV